MLRLIHCCLVGVLLVSPCFAAEWGMKSGNPGLKSAGPLAFGQNGVLFVGDTKAAAVVAIDTGDRDGDANEMDLHIHGIEKELAKVVASENVTVNDLAVNPESGVAYISVGVGDEKAPAIVRVRAGGKLEKLDTTKVDFAKVELPDAPADAVVGQGRRKKNFRDESITDLAFSDGKVLVSGVVGKGQANVRELVFPFSAIDKGTNIEIYHGAHGRYETNASVKTFVPFKIDGEPHLLAGFQCTPLVKFPVKAFAESPSVRGTTVAELGNRNRPLDMIVYEQGGEEFLLITNTARGVMKVSTDNIERPEGITERVSGKAGQSYDEIKGLKGVQQMDRLNDANILVIAKNDDDSLDLHTVALP